MTRWLLFFALLCFFTAVPTAYCGDAAEKSISVPALEDVAEALRVENSETYSHHAGKGQQLSQAFATLTGEAANPLLGVTLRSVYVYYQTPSEKRAGLPWFYQSEVWLPLVLLMLGMVFKGTIGEAVPVLKKPLDAAADLVSKGGAVVSLPLVLAVFADSFAAPVSEAVTTLSNFAFPSVMAAEGDGTAGGVMKVVGWAVSLTLGLAVYCTVWLAFSTIEVLILVSPFPAVDAVLKSFRLAVIGSLCGISQLSPTGGLLSSLLLVLVCSLVAGWSLRLSVFGFLYSLDIVFLRSRRARLAPGRIQAFAGASLTDRVPIRTLGVLGQNEEGIMTFFYRPWLVFPRKALTLDVETSGLDVGLGLLNPYLVKPTGEGGFQVLFRFPPRYQGHEEELCSLLRAGAVRDTSVLRGIRNLFSFLRGERWIAANPST